MHHRFPLTMLFAAMTISAPAANLGAQQPTVALRGTVLDSNTARPAAGVAVYVDRSTLSQETDSAGSFLLEGLESGPHVLDFLKDGYSARTFNFVITERHEGELSAGIVLLPRGPAPTASISGIVLDSMTGSPVASADVRVNGEHVAATDGDGAFSIPSAQLQWGTNLLEFQHLGYSSQMAELWPTTERSALYSEFMMMPLSVELEEVVVEGERAVGNIGRVDEFVRRVRMGSGHYITRADIENRQPQKVTDLLGRLPGVMVLPDVRGGLVRIQSRGEYSILNKRSESTGWGCRPDFFVDGVRLNIMIGGEGEIETSIDNWVHPGEVDGIEVYKGPATTPARFRQMDSGCGAIVIWTR